MIPCFSSAEHTEARNETTSGMLPYQDTAPVYNALPFCYLKGEGQTDEGRKGKAVSGEHVGAHKDVMEPVEAAEENVGVETEREI